MVRSRELHALQTYLDNTTYSRLLHSVSAWLSLIGGKHFSLFSINDGLFAFLSGRNAGESDSGELALEVVKRSEFPWIIGASRIDIPFQTAIINCPRDCRDVPRVMDYIEQFVILTEMFSDRHIIYGRDFIPDKHLRLARVAYELQKCLDAKNVALSFQPVYSVREAHPVALEVLILLTLPDGETAHQSEVLHVAERTGMAQRLGELVMENAFTWFVINELPLRGIKQLQLRLLESQCIESDWPRIVARLAEKTGMDLSCVCIEITEKSVVNTTPVLKYNMDCLSAQKVSFALDDYGSGYTDFSEILDMPFSLIKLDKSIVQAGLETTKGERLLQGSISLFKRIERPIVAEGIETEEQARILSDMGCDYLQGYWAGYPAKSEALLSLLTFSG